MVKVETVCNFTNNLDVFLLEFQSKNNNNYYSSFVLTRILTPRHINIHDTADDEAANDGLKVTQWMKSF